MGEHETDVEVEAVADAGDVPRPEPTGVPRVDAVVAAVDALREQPLDEHVAVLEEAHAELRRTLDDPSAGGSD